jgi:hypothetical protein
MEESKPRWPCDCGRPGFVEDRKDHYLCRKCLCARDNRLYLPDEGENGQPSAPSIQLQLHPQNVD